MKIEHIAIWVKDLEDMRTFYMKYFNMVCNQKYINSKKEFSSYFLSFESGARIELMHRPDVLQNVNENSRMVGLTHLAISLGSKNKVAKFTQKIKTDGYQVIQKARTTGDGYYESVISDPEGNHIEITE